MRRSNTPLGHIYRSASHCVDYLARMGVEQEEDLVVVVDTPIFLLGSLLRGTTLILVSF
ncbi:hypothetical protein RHMOL_Rhmol04G0184700 [Rhododendron molle]|uniref:Uncharacterized protein n=1 Tax=Rhododendron molle TaxID=49168 RepID=A0ACC0P4A9_RHOML|nr:hypothetical protein RHMOL_Rhmol04G0184700 [Rhododendron molle]